jgi:hypothetical protein
MIGTRTHGIAALLLASSLVACSSLEVSRPEGRAAQVASVCNGAPDASRPQFIVGYGSLMEDESRMRTSPNAGPAYPAEIKGYRRGWFARGEAVGFSTTYLGVLPDRESHLNGVIYRVDAAELVATDKRERSYCRASVASTDIELLARGISLPPDGQTWIYVSKPESVAIPDSRYPIVQSYVDVFLSGCLEQEERFGLAGFSRQCISTTADWSDHWVNDRIYPRRAFVFQPRASQIDRLLITLLPRHFGRIRIEP